MSLNTTILFIFRIIWILLMMVNFAVQLVYYFNDRSSRLFVAKKATTPLLLLFGLVIVIICRGGFPIMPGAVLLAMGLGELGIEGSNVVEDRADSEGPGGATGIVVVLAGVLFLLVNIFIGLWLLFNRKPEVSLVSVFGAAVVVIAVMLLISFLISKPASSVRTQMILYSIGLSVLLAGVISDAVGGFSLLGVAAAVLTVSDSLVLIRMGAGLDKNTRSGYRILLVFLIVILLLYYFYMWLLIELGCSAV